MRHLGGLFGLVLRLQRLDQARHRPAIVRIVFKVLAVYRFSLGMPARRDQRLAQRLPRRIVPEWRLHVGQRILRRDRKGKVRNRLVMARLGAGNLALQQFIRNRQQRAGRIVRRIEETDLHAVLHAGQRRALFLRRFE